jgi:hypothetical protein
MNIQKISKINIVLFCLFFINISLYSDINLKGNIYIKQSHTYIKDNNIYKNQTTLGGKIDIKKEFSNNKFFLSTNFIKDNKDNNKDKIFLNEIYYQRFFENSEVLFGKNIRFWGSLEAFNISDIFNTKNILFNPFKKEEKLGSFNLSYQYFLKNDNDISFIIQSYQEKQQRVTNKTYYYDLPLVYDKNYKTTFGKYKPTIYLKYNQSLSTQDDIQLDYSLIYANGYDNNRALAISPFGKLYQQIYKTQKYLAYLTAIKNNTIFKAEYSYTKINDDKIPKQKAKDYYQVGAGAEYTWYQVYDKIDLTFYLEYYKSNSINKIIYFNDDIFAMASVKFNDFSSSKFDIKMIKDRKTKQKITILDFQRRIFDDFTIKISMQKQNKSKKYTNYFLKLIYNF